MNDRELDPGDWTRRPRRLRIGSVADAPLIEHDVVSLQGRSLDAGQLDQRRAVIGPRADLR